MSLDALLARLEARALTPVTDARTHDVTEKLQQMRGCMAVTLVTAESIIAAVDCPLVASDMCDFYEERAAIAEYDGGLSRNDAQTLASVEFKNFKLYHRS